MPRSKKPRKKQAPKQKVLNVITGCQMLWSNRDPLLKSKEMIDMKFTHRNPLRRLNMEAVRPIAQKMVSDMCLKWKVEIELEFKDANGKQYFRGADLVIHGKLKDLDDTYHNTIEDVFKESNMKQYVMTHIKCEILGDSQIQERDFA